jgi:hypothetical protein
MGASVDRLLLGADEGPDLIALDSLAGKVHKVLSLVRLADAPEIHE